jgi:2-iminobutanoate/2-iminopropanoate deaminase
MKRSINLDEKLEGSAPFTAAVEANGFVFISGQIASVKGTRTVITDNINKEAEQVMKNLGDIFAVAGFTYDHLVKCTIYLTNLQYYTAVNAAYQACFKGEVPARETVAVKELPRGANVEISGIAVKG